MFFAPHSRRRRLRHPRSSSCKREAAFEHDQALVVSRRSVLNGARHEPFAVYTRLAGLAKSGYCGADCEDHRGRFVGGNHEPRPASRAAEPGQHRQARRAPRPCHHGGLTTDGSWGATRRGPTWWRTPAICWRERCSRWPTCSAPMASARFGRTGANGFTTAEVKCNFISTIRDGAATFVSATLLHGGRTTQVWDAETRSEGTREADGGVPLHPDHPLSARVTASTPDTGDHLVHDAVGPPMRPSARRWPACLAVGINSLLVDRRAAGAARRDGGRASADRRADRPGGDDRAVRHGCRHRRPGSVAPAAAHLRLIGRRRLARTGAWPISRRLGTPAAIPGARWRADAAGGDGGRAAVDHRLDDRAHRRHPSGGRVCSSYACRPPVQLVARPRLFAAGIIDAVRRGRRLPRPGRHGRDRLGSFRR